MKTQNRKTNRRANKRPAARPTRAARHVLALLGRLTGWKSRSHRELATALWACSECDAPIGEPCRSAAGGPLRRGRLPGTPIVHEPRGRAAAAASGAIQVHELRKRLVDRDADPRVILGELVNTRLVKQLVATGKLGTLS